MPAAIEVDRERIAEFCRRHHIRRLALFGSVLRDDFTPDSDVDVLVEFEPEHVPGLAFFGMEEVNDYFFRRRGACDGGGMYGVGKPGRGSRSGAGRGAQRPLAIELQPCRVTDSSACSSRRA